MNAPEVETLNLHQHSFYYSTKIIAMPSIASLCGKGWLKDYPDFRDNTPSTHTLSKRQIARVPENL